MLELLIALYERFGRQRLQLGPELNRVKSSAPIFRKRFYWRRLWLFVLFIPLTCIWIRRFARSHFAIHNSLK